MLTTSTGRRKPSFSSNMTTVAAGSKKFPPSTNAETTMQPMKKKLGPGSPRVIRTQADPTPLARRGTRYGAWAGALAEKFRQQVNLPGWRPQTLVHSLPARRPFLFFRNLQKFYLERYSRTAATIMNNFFLQKVVLSSSVLPASQTVNAGRVPRPQARQGAQIFEAPQHRERKWLLVEKTVDLFRWSPARTGNASAAISFHDAIEVRRRILRGAAGPDALPSEIAARILRQVRRVEERPAGQPLDTVVAPSVVRVAGSVLEPSQGMPVREISITPAFSSLSATPLPAPFNVAQLTDEVMRQLDRRLVAARERMGKL